jgi:hypothetical protein
VVVLMQAFVGGVFFTIFFGVPFFFPDPSRENRQTDMTKLNAPPMSLMLLGSVAIGAMVSSDHPEFTQIANPMFSPRHRYRDLVRFS